MTTVKIKKWKRICPNPDRNPNCEKELFYSTKGNKVRAEKQNTNCRSCAMMVIFRVEEIRKKISESLNGITRSEETREKLRKAWEFRKLIPFTEETRKKMREAKKGIKREPFTDEHKKNLRISATKNGQKIPNFNKTACLYFDWLNKWNGWNGQHALNGGEKEVNGYFVDYFEPTLNMVIEWDEEYHYENNKLREKDIRRQKEIVGELRCTFHRIRGKDILK